MNKYIDAEKTIRDWCGRNCGCEPNECGHTFEKDGTEACTFVDFINEQPTIDVVKRKIGKWIKQNPFVDTEECSLCKYSIYSEELETPFCPWCGAEMNKGK